MNNLLMPILVTGIFALFLIALSIFKPNASRYVYGIFFLVMALVVNLPLTLLNPHLYVDVAYHTWLPLYQWLFSVLIAWNPALFATLLVLFETTVGVLILSKGRAVKFGLVFATLFCLFVFPIGVEELTSPLVGLGAALLLKQTFRNSAWDGMIGRIKSKPTRMA